ncbi:hypothetical protein N7495_007023 [Penicillium taxi]|uniref:uncharacterized protein n=1 Tax=Penicillium taxi TaxID=168475 RepID=UPI002544DF1E|nr:uncharacterized protein N7495_007023 [Penicillium taxi]KAJ5895332.1 hypothetical protein N7495_007023 [Penicillium taxi]
MVHSTLNRKGDDAIIPGNLITRRSITFSILFSFCHFGSIGILNYYLPEWFQAVEGASPLESGTRVLASVLAQIVGTLTSSILGKLNTRVSRANSCPLPSLNIFFQFLGATVTQVIGSIVFRSILSKSLDDHGLNATQRALLSAAGTADIRKTVNANFPKLLSPVLDSYNKAITSTFVSGPSMGEDVEEFLLTSELR